jgi:uncharacterized protein YbjT (DUF2867 family)
MLDLDSLVTAMHGADAVITTAAGYTRGGKDAHAIDTIGNANLAEAAHRAGIRRLVLTSILTSDQTPHVPHSPAARSSCSAPSPRPKTPSPGTPAH